MHPKSFTSPVVSVLAAALIAAMPLALPLWGGARPAEAADCSAAAAGLSPTYVMYQAYGGGEYLIAAEVYLQNPGAAAGCTIRVCLEEWLGYWYGQECANSTVASWEHYYLSGTVYLNCDWYYTSPARFRSQGSFPPPGGSGVTYSGPETRFC